MGTKVVIEVKEGSQVITENEIRTIRDLDGVMFVNRLTSNAVDPANFNPITKSDSGKENNCKVTLLSCDDLERDSAFSDLRYRLMKGNMITDLASLTSRNEDTYNLYADYTASFYLDFYLIPYFKTIRIPQHIIDHRKIRIRWMFWYGN